MDDRERAASAARVDTLFAIAKALFESGDPTHRIAAVEALRVATAAHLEHVKYFLGPSTGAADS
ncbi:MAG: hypothetical protein JWM57_488 [Phycisphaerales bacterium]|nr:hypothetical protein [Phycisphaerales bacterium]